MKKIFNELKVIFFQSCVALFCGYLLLVLVNLIPNHSIERNLKISSDIFMKEGNYPSIYLNGTFLENFSDADAFAVAYNRSTLNPFYNALNAYNYSFLKPKAQDCRGVKALRQTAEKDFKDMHIYNHSQEWHGFQIWLRPLLIRYNLPDIRFFGYFICFMLMLAVCIQICKLCHDEFAFLPFAIGCLYFHYPLESMSILLSTDICVMFSGCLAVLWAEKHHKEFYNARIFAMIGVAAFFFSMFNMPMITLGFPIIVWLIVTEKKHFDAEKRILNTIWYSFSWLIGYSIAVFSKTLIKYLMQTQDVIYTFRWYIGAEGKIVTHSERMNNLKRIMTDVLDRSLIEGDLLLLAIFVILIYVMYRKRNISLNFRKYIPYVLAASYPCIWIYFITIHSNLDWTVFLFGISIFSIFGILYDMCKTVSKKKN